MSAKKSKKKRAAAPEKLAEAKSFTAEDQLCSEGKIVWVILLVLVAFIPLAMSNGRFFGFEYPFTHDIYDTFKIAFLRIGSVTALAFFIFDLLKNGMKLKTSPLYWLLGAFLALTVVSSFTSISFVISFFGKYRRYEGLWTYFIYATLFFLAVQYASNFTRVKQLARTLSYSSAAVAFYGLLQAIGIEPFMQGVGFEQGRSYSSYGNPDFLAGYLAFGVFVTLGLILSEKVTVHRVSYWLILLLNAAVSITAYARSIWVGIFVALIAFVVIFVLSKTRFEKLDYGFMGGVGGAVALLAASSVNSANEVTNFVSRVTSIFKFSEGSANTRFLIWQAAIDAIKDKPLLGFGPDTFRLVFRRYAPDAYARYAGYASVADNVHNYVLQLAAGIGIPGMILYYAFGIAIAVMSFPLIIGKRLEKTGIDAKQALLYAGFWLAILAYQVHLFFGISLSGVSFLLFLSYGVLVSPLCKTVNVPALRTYLAYPLIGLSLIFALVVSGFSFNLMLADGEYFIAKTAYNDRNIYAYLDYAERAVKRNPYNDVYQTELFLAKSDIALYSGMGFLAKTDGSSYSEEEVASAINDANQQAQKAIDFMPWEYDNYSLVIAYYTQLAGNLHLPEYYQKAKELAEKQIPKTPNGLALRLAYAEVLVALGEDAKAEKELEFIIEHDPNFEKPREILQNMRNMK